MPKSPSWNEVPCPACKEPVAPDATRCPHCQTVYSPEEIAAMKAALKGQWKAGGIGCGVVLLLILGVAMCSSDDEPVGTGDPKTDAIALYNQMLATASECDAAAATMGERVQAGEPVTAYRAAEVAASACLPTDTKMRALAIPSSFDDEDRATAEKAIGACGAAYTAKWSQADTIKDAIDEGASPSRLAAIQRNAENYESMSMLCAGGLAVIATKHGAAPKELGLEE